MMPGVVQVQTTLPDEPSARRIASSLVEARLAACVQVLGPLHSTYRWKGRVDQATEWLCLVKTAEGALDALLPRLRELHPYDTPEIIVLPVLGGDPSYLEWVQSEVGSEKGEGRSKRRQDDGRG